MIKVAYITHLFSRPPPPLLSIYLVTVTFWQLQLQTFSLLPGLLSSTYTMDHWNMNTGTIWYKMLPRVDVWTKSEEGRSWCSRVIDRKQNGYRRRDLPTFRQTNMCKAICLLFFLGGHTKIYLICTIITLLNVTFKKFTKCFNQLNK